MAGDATERDGGRGHGEIVTTIPESESSVMVELCEVATKIGVLLMVHWVRILRDDSGENAAKD